MSERGGRGQYSNRGGDRGGRGGRGASRGGRGGHGAPQEKHKKESILDLSKYMEKKIRVRFNGGREVVGTLMGYDPLLNLVLDNTTEYQKGLCYLYVKVANLLPSVDLETGYVTENKRELGLSVLRGTAIILISPFDGMEEIENPFAQ